MKQKPLDLVNDPLLRRVAKKNQELPKYTKPPDSRPCAICFDVNGPSVAHSTVVEHLGTLLSEFEEDIKVEALEFQPRSVLLNSVNADNRWVITLSSQYSVTCVSGTKLTLGPHKEVTLRSYDDVMSLEYKQFTSKSNFMKMLHKAE
nr:hypothetical protein BaRGS_018822 [Batillaria attramentaria]